MNYGKKNAAKIKWQLTSRGTVMRRKVKSLTLLIILLCFVLVLGYGGYRGYQYVEQIIAEAPDINEIDATPSGYMSTVLDAKGNVTAQLVGTGSNRVYVTLDEIPEELQKAFVAIEDERFYDHNGIDLRGIVRAGIKGVTTGHFSEGASTITQQLARTIFLNNDRTWQRKMEEIFIATELEKKYTKDEILEFYLNNIYFGNGYYGIQAASRGYFDTDVSFLSLSQMAYLCAIPNNPTMYNPYKNPDNTLGRRDRILKNMYEDGKISRREYKDARQETIVLSTAEPTKRYDAVETYACYCATRALMEQQGFEFRTDFSSEEDRKTYEDAYQEQYKTCEQSLYTGGYRIYTSIDLNMEEQLQNAVDEKLQDFTDVNEEGIYTLQSAAVCIDNETGFVKAIVGGRSQEYDGHMLNRAYQSYRQPGSAIKPLIVYTPALERGYTPDTVVEDAPIEDGPENASGRYLGSVTLRYAVENSINTVAWNLLEEMTPVTGISYLKEMNFAKLSPEDERPAASLGGFTNGVSPVEMAAAYATIENDGKYREPTCIVEIQDADGNAIYQKIVDEKQVYKTNAARWMTNILEGVLTQGTAKGMALSETASAAKTGTTNSNKDGWFVGYTKYYTTSVWVGYDIPAELPGLTGASYPGEIWYDYMENLHKELPYADFVAPLGTGNDADAESGTDVTEGNAAENDTIENDTTGDNTAPAEEERR